MNEAVYIHGIGAIPSSEFTDRSNEVGPRPFIDFSVLTDGEMQAVLLYEQLGIIKDFYPELSLEYQTAQDKILNSINRGVHIGAVDTATGYGEVMRLVNKVLREAKYKNRPAAGKFPGIGEIPAYNPLVGENCEPILEELREVRRKVFPSKSKERAIETRLIACKQQEALVNILNTHLEKSGHHLIYAYAPTNIRTQFPTIAAKRVLHNSAIGGFHNISKLSEENLRTWLRNGIMRHNAQGGLDPLQPEATLELFRDSVVDSSQSTVGVLDPATVTLIISLVLAALKATIDLIAALNQQERNQLLASAQAIGTQGFGLEESDFEGGSASTGLPSWALPVGAGLAAYLLLSK